MRRNNVESFMEIGTSLVYVVGSKLSEKLYVVKTKLWKEFQKVTNKAE